MFKTGLMYVCNGLVCFKGDLILKMISGVAELEHAHTRVYGKKLHWVRIGAFPNKTFDIKEQLKREERKELAKPRQPRESRFHREILDHLEECFEENEASQEEEEPTEEPAPDPMRNMGASVAASAASAKADNQSTASSPLRSTVATFVPSAPRLLDTPMKLKIGASRIDEALSKEDFPFLSKLGISLSTDYDVSWIARNRSAFSKGELC